MNNDKFKDRMKKLEQERDEFLEKLTAEGQQEYQQKKEEYNQSRGSGQEGTPNQHQQR